MTGVRKVEVCTSNLRLGTKLICDRVRETFPAIQVNRYACLGRCDRCIKVPYVLIDDHIYIEAENPEALWIKVKTYIESHIESLNKSKINIQQQV